MTISNDQFQTYFNDAHNWAKDRYFSLALSRKRYQWAFLCSFGVVCILGLAIMLMIPLQRIQPIVIHKNDSSNEIWVEPLKNDYVPTNAAEVQYQLAHYVMAREGYSAVDYQYRYHLVALQSNNSVQKEYAKLQAPSDGQSPLAIFKDKGLRNIHVESVVFLDKAGIPLRERIARLPSHNLAQVNFIATDTVNEMSTKRYFVATIAWTYLGAPSNPEAAFENWNGFTVTYYRIDPRAIPQDKEGVSV